MTRKLTLTDRQVQDLSQERFAVTTPFVQPVTSVNLFRGRVEGPLVVGQGSAEAVDLNRQDFTRFRGATSSEHVASLAADYGLIGLKPAVDALGSPPVRERPIWWWALTEDPADWVVEPVEDWIRQAGLVDLAYGLLGLMSEPWAIDTLVTVARALNRAGGSVDEILAAQSVRTRAAPWPVRLILDGAARAGMVCVGLDEEVQPTGPDREPRLRRWVTFWGVGWRTITDDQGLPVPTQSYTMEATPHGVAMAFAALVNPWLKRVRHGLRVSDDRLQPMLRLPGDLLAELWLQLAAASLANVGPRQCAWVRCPGPPERPGIFLWRWGTTPTGTKHRDSIYCHRLCQHAALMARKRQEQAASREDR